MSPEMFDFVYFNTLWFFVAAVTFQNKRNVSYLYGYAAMIFIQLSD